MELMLQLTTQGSLIPPLFAGCACGCHASLKTSATSVDAIVALELEADARAWIRTNDLSDLEGNWSTHVAQFGNLCEILNIAATLPWRVERSRSAAAAESMIGGKP